MKEFDYTSTNWYFVTVCTKNRKRLFLSAVDPRFTPDNQSNVAAASYAANNTSIFIRCLNDLSNKYYDNITIDFYCSMSDHIHIIFIFNDKVIKKGAIGSRSYSLGDIIRTLKATVSRDIGKPIWQPNFYEHIIRDEKSLDKIREYILNNPAADYREIPWRTIDPV